LEKSEEGGRVVFNVFEGEDIFWADLQMEKKWGYERGINQAMVAKRLFYLKLHELYQQEDKPQLSFYGFKVPKKVWTNQVNIIPVYFKAFVTIMKFFGAFISIEKWSGKFIAWQKNKFVEMNHDPIVLDKEMQDKLWRTSLDLIDDEKTRQIAKGLSAHMIVC